jgi:hypothetical protein
MVALLSKSVAKSGPKFTRLFVKKLALEHRSVQKASSRADGKTRRQGGQSEQ